MWIRSQDREDLIKANYFSVRGEKRLVGVKEIIVYQILASTETMNSADTWGSGYFIGTYKSNERCLDILDDIENALVEDKKIYYMPEI